MKPRGIYRPVNWRWVQPLLRVRIIAVAVAWFFQGMLYAGRTEVIFRLVLCCVMTAILATLLNLVMPLPAAIVIGFIVAHTLNFLFNGQLYVVLKHFSPTGHDKESVFHHMVGLQRRLQREPSILAAGVWGSFARGEPNEYPDIDLRIIRRRGTVNGIRACWFLLTERTRALFLRLPLDGYIWDNLSGLSRLRQDEVPIVLHDPQAILKERYPEAKTIIQSDSYQDYRSNCKEMAEKILKNIPEAVSTIKSLINKGMKTDLETGLRMEAEMHKGPISPTGEGRQRITALVEKR